MLLFKARQSVLCMEPVFRICEHVSVCS